MPIPRAPLAALVLFLAGGALGGWSDDLRETPRPPAGPASLLGGFSALAVQVLWIRAHDAIRAGDHGEALLHLDLISEIEPQLVRGAEYIAHEVGINLATDVADDDSRFGLQREGLAVLDRAVESNPGVAEARTLRGHFTLRCFTRDPGTLVRFLESEGRSPYEAALLDFRAAVELDPSDLAAVDGRGIAALFVARDLLALGDIERMSGLLDEAEAAYVEALRRYREGGMSAVPEIDQALAITRGLQAVVAAPEAERARVYRLFYSEFGGRGGLPGLPPPVPE